MTNFSNLTIDFFDKCLFENFALKIIYNTSTPPWLKN